MKTIRLHRSVKKIGLSALVLLSGGQDSTTCLAWALTRFNHVETISFDYGQRHKIELHAAAKIAKKLGLQHKILKINIFKELGKNALTHDIPIKVDPTGKKLPTTFVPGRNIIFLTAATAYAYQKNIHHLVTGVCQTDYSGYPDCRNQTIKALEKTLAYGMEYDLTIHTPLMFLTKAETVLQMKELGCFDLLKESHTCYEGKKPACGRCPACELRIKGFQEAGIMDPLPYSITIKWDERQNTPQQYVQSENQQMQQREKPEPFRRR